MTPTAIKLGGPHHDRCAAAEGTVASRITTAMPAQKGTVHRRFPHHDRYAGAESTVASRITTALPAQKAPFAVA